MKKIYMNIAQEQRHFSVLIYALISILCNEHHCWFIFFTLCGGLDLYSTIFHVLFDPFKLIHSHSFIQINNCHVYETWDIQTIAEP